MKKEELKKQVNALIDQHKDDTVKFLQKLVSYRSTAGYENDVQQYYAAKLRELNAEVDLFEPDLEYLKKKYPPELFPNDFTTDRESYKGSPVIGAVIKGAGGGKSLMLSGHMDTVEPGNGEWITGSAFTPMYKDGMIYGRGSCDMKSGHAAIYTALKALKAAGIKLKGDVTVAASIDEEIGNNGMMAILDRGYRADACINTEPTAEKVVVSAPTALMYRIHIKGKATHGGTTYLGVNAIYKAIPFIERIHAFEEERRLELFHKVPLYEDRVISFCVGVNMIRAGVMPSVVPEEAVLEGRIGITPLEDANEVRLRFEKMIADVAQADPWMKEHPPVIDYHHKRWVSHSLATDHPLAQLVAANYKELTGKEAEFKGFLAATDAGTIHSSFGIPTLDFGAGPDTTLHKINECISADSVVNVAKVLAGCLIDWCEVAE